MHRFNFQPPPNPQRSPTPLTPVSERHIQHNKHTARITAPTALDAVLFLTGSTTPTNPDKRAGRRYRGYKTVSGWQTLLTLGWPMCRLQGCCFLATPVPRQQIVRYYRVVETNVVLWMESRSGGFALSLKCLVQRCCRSLRRADAPFSDVPRGKGLKQSSTPSTNGYMIRIITSSTTVRM